MKDDSYYMNIALKEAYKAYKNDEIPVGAVIIDNNSGKIISKGYNKKEKKNISIFHAEIDAIIKASKKLNNWRLNNCTLYVTLYPCKMCLSVIEESKIKRVVYGTNQYNNINIEKVIINKNNNIEIENKCSELIIDKFNEIRKKQNCG